MMSQSQSVHLHLHKKTHSQIAQSHVRKSTTSTPVPVSIPFVTRLPMNHPLNNNVPYSGFSFTVAINNVTNHAVPLVTHPSPQPYGGVPHALPQQHVGVPNASPLLSSTSSH